METVILVIFVLGYLAIMLEHPLKVNKAAPALLAAVLCWTILAYCGKTETIESKLAHHLGEIAQILFFLMGAMMIVEVIDAHGGFESITSRIRSRKKIRLLWIVGLLTFFMSSVLDNLTTAIVMVALLSKLIEDRNLRLYYVAMVIIAANAGGAWSPIGDVTTTMLWIKGKFDGLTIMQNLFLPSLISLAVPLALLSFSPKMKGFVNSSGITKKDETLVTRFQKRLVLLIGLGGLAFVPIFKVLTHLSPLMGMLLSLSILWCVIEWLHKDKNGEAKHLSPASALERVDIQSILFFLGILLMVGALETSGLLGGAATLLDQMLPNRNIAVMTIGLLSSVVDNVPLVAGAIEMYTPENYPELGMNAQFWQFLAYCAGTGGSILIIGSAAGVSAMGTEKINFFWYLKQVSWLALLGYLAGAGAFLLQQATIN